MLEPLSLHCLTLRNSIIKIKYMKSRRKAEGAQLTCMDLEAVDRRCSSKYVSLKIFTNVTGKHLSWSIFLIKLQALTGLQLY